MCFPLLYRHLVDIGFANGKHFVGRQTVKRSATLGDIENLIEFGKNSVKPIRIFVIRADSKCENTAAAAAAVCPTR
ncbi:hypothetical protein AWC06_03825 [Mycobacterium fragae]|uniref:Uncharacterized protein n=1 Tax=Mycobacterium fragae TaxID=1260918 RepID=A0A1X1UFG6_9MYCO|nr:hypothetical protein AWC06_03825 [Mycobacterium fragae]